MYSAAKDALVEWLRFEDLTRHYGAQDVFAGLSGVLRDAQKVGLVGANGAGKSSLLRLLAGQETPDGGRVTGGAISPDGRQLALVTAGASGAAPPAVSSS